MPNRRMYDSTNPAGIPDVVEMVAGYINGSFNWAARVGAFDKWPKAAHVRIDVTGANPASAGVLDVETGDATPAHAPQWIRDRTSIGMRPVIYCNRSTMPLVLQATGDLIHGKDYWFWIATLDGTKTLPDMTGVIAVQFADSKMTGFDADESIVYDDTWHAEPVPTEPVKTLDGIVIVLPHGAARAVISTDNGKTWQ
jgi:hypothetical protein